MSKPTRGKSHDYDLEEENRGLKWILPKNPTLQDFRNSTLLYEEAQVVDEKVRKLLKIRKNPQTEPGHPDFTGTVKEMRVFLRGYIGNPTKEGPYTNPEGKKLNPALLDWEEESNR